MTDRIFPDRVIEEFASLVGATMHTVQDALPPKAQQHLMAAQRELFLALTTTLEHHSGRGKRSATPAQKKKSATAKRPKRVPLD